MKSLLLIVVAFSILNVAHAMNLATCAGDNFKVIVKSGNSENDVTVTLNGTSYSAKRAMSNGRVLYTASNFKFEIIGLHRQMGNPLGYVDINSKTEVVVCTKGIDVLKVTDDTDLY